MYVFSYRDGSPPTIGHVVFALLVAETFMEAATIVAASPRFKKKHHGQIRLEFSCRKDEVKGVFWQKLADGTREMFPHNTALYHSYRALRGGSNL